MCHCLLASSAVRSAKKTLLASKQWHTTRENIIMARDITKTALGLQPHQIILRPLVTEKGMHKASRCNAYAFEVSRRPARTTCAGRWSNCST